MTRRVLVVDDETAIVEGVTLLLDFEQIESAGATDRSGAVTILSGTFFPVIITDLCLETKEEGLQLIDDIHSLSPRTKVIVLSAYAGEMEDELLRRGVTTVIQKPATAETLLGTVNDLLGEIEKEAEKNEVVDLEQLYLTVRTKLYHIPRSRFGLSHEQAEDVVQEAWLLFLEKHGYIRFAGPWLAGAAANLSRQKIDQRVRKRESSETDEVFNAHADSSHRDPHIVIAVRQALARVDDRTRTLCVLIGLKGLSYEEASGVTGLPLGSIGPLYIRAKKKLRNVLAH